MRADKEKSIKLLKTARGQIDGLIKMIEQDRYCLDISHQVMAAEAILKKANREILKSHIEGCVLEAFSSDDEKLKAKNSEEILNIINSLAK